MSDSVDGDINEKRPIKNSHYGMERTGNEHPSKGFEYRCPVCDETMYWGEAKRHHHRGPTSTDEDETMRMSNSPQKGPLELLRDAWRRWR